jgi:hypothetical protein
MIVFCPWFSDGAGAFSWPSSEFFGRFVWRCRWGGAPDPWRFFSRGMGLVFSGEGWVAGEESWESCSCESLRREMTSGSLAATALASGG